jgi:hypothetical protein
MRKSIYCCVSALVIAVAALGKSAHSQMAGDPVADGTDELSEITVTANRREENLGRHLSPVFSAVFRILAYSPLLKSIPQGAATTCYVATSPALANVSGVYFSDCNPKVPSPPGARWRHGRTASDGFGGAGQGLPLGRLLGPWSEQA